MLRFYKRVETNLKIRKHYEQGIKKSISFIYFTKRQVLLFSILLIYQDDNLIFNLIFTGNIFSILHRTKSIISSNVREIFASKLSIDTF